MKIKQTIKRLIKLIRTKEKIPVIQYVDESKCFENKTIFIVGGTGGIGYEIAKEFFKCGANIIISGSNEGTVKEKVLNLGNNYSSKNCEKFWD